MATLSDIDLLEMLAIEEAREDLHAYRLYMHPKLKTGWFVEDLNKHLQEFYEELIAGNRPKLAIVTPPQHGKSSAVVDFVCWFAGKHPEYKTIFTSFSERLGIRANLAIQRVLGSNKYRKVFPNTRINTIGAPDTFGATRNRELLEYIDNDGYFRNTTVKGQITGESLDLGIIDDPLKGREAANSEAVRDSIWDWLTDDFLTRFSDLAGLLVVATRWHIDDPISRLKEHYGEELKTVRYTAIAANDEEYRKEGEPLFPELKSKSFLMGIKKVMSSESWAALYDGDPRVSGGMIIRGEWFRRHRILPKIKERRIYVDTAQKIKTRNDYSVLECWGKGTDGIIYLIDLVRGKWEAPELERRTIDFWVKHLAQNSFEMGRLSYLKIEDKVSGTGLIQKLKKQAKDESGNNVIIPVVGIERNIDKYTRVTDVVGYIEAGWVSIPESAPFVNDFIAECEAFTADDSHLYDDQIDPMCDAISDFIGPTNALNTWAKLGGAG